MCVLSIARLLQGVGRWARKPVNHTSWVAVVTPTDRPKSVRNRCLIELFCDVVCVVALPFWHFCWCRGFCHRTGPDLLLFVFNVTINDISVIYVTAHTCAGGLKKLDLRSGSQRHRHFVGFFNVPVLAPTRDLNNYNGNELSMESPNKIFALDQSLPSFQRK